MSFLEHECPPALVVESLSAGYPGLSTVLDHASFVVECGERVGVLGPNGAGKSTLFKAIVGLIPHHTGQISIHGEDCRTSHSMVGYVPQQDLIDWNFPVTVRDVVMMGRTRKIGWLRYPSRKHWEAVDAALAQVSMVDFRFRQIGELSGGQRRRVFIARALAQETDVLLLDEPFSGVDAAAEQEIMQTLDLLKQARISVLVATHDLSTAQSYFDKLLLIKKRVIAFDVPDTVFTAENLGEAYGKRLGVIRQNGHTMLVADAH